ncbi:MAG TPA: MBL fold metallo-hydrolase [Thiotrichales bacterium]|nr:MBL fold metallo-hydrolase [Thiotrichales bacterium]
MNSIKGHPHVWGGLFLALAWAFPLLAQEEHFSREEVAHGFGTDPSFTHLPSTAIDTDDVPNMVIPADVPADEPLPTYKLAENTWFFYGNIAEVDENNRGWNGNAGFVVTSEGVVVIDSLGTPKLGKRMIATIRRVTDKPIRMLIITHNHPDHAYGAIAFRDLPGITIVGHKGTLKYLESDRIDHSVSYRSTFIAEDMEGFEPVRPDVLIDDALYSRQTFRVGDRTFHVYNTGAHHSYGDLVVHQVEDGIVWISDLAFNGRVTFMADGSSKAAIAAQEWLLEHFSEARLMVPGHGSAQTPEFPMVARTRDYMMRLRKAMAEAFEAGLELQEAVEQGDFEDWKKVRLYGLNHRPNLNFVYREMEQELF